MGADTGFEWEVENVDRLIGFNPDRAKGVRTGLPTSCRRAFVHRDIKIHLEPTEAIRNGRWAHSSACSECSDAGAACSGREHGGMK
jgi:hypothetical protein